MDDRAVGADTADRGEREVEEAGLLGAEGGEAHGNLPLVQGRALVDDRTPKPGEEMSHRRAIVQVRREHPGELCSVLACLAKDERRGGEDRAAARREPESVVD